MVFTFLLMDLYHVPPLILYHHPWLFLSTIQHLCHGNNKIIWLWVLSCPLYLLNSYTWLLIDIPRPLYGRILSKLSPHHQILVLYNSMGLSRTYDKGDDTTNIYLQKTKSLFDELATAGQPIALADSISMFLGVCVENSKTWLLTSPPKLRHLLILSYIVINSRMNIFIKLLLWPMF